MKYIYLLLVLLLFTSASAQDIIVKMTGEEVESKVVLITDTELHYKDYTNLDGPVYIISIKDVFMIKMEGGAKRVFQGNLPDPPSQYADLSEEELFILGQKDAQKEFSSTGTVVGASAVACYLPGLSIPLLMYILSRDPKISNADYPKQELVQVESYRTGFNKKTKELRAKNIYYGMVIGTAFWIGYIAVALIQSQGL